MDHEYDFESTRNDKKGFLIERIVANVSGSDDSHGVK